MPGQETPQVGSLAEDTRTTVCPRRPKYTAIGSHIGPVGSITTISVVPSAAPVSATRSSSPKLAAVEDTRRRAATRPVPSSTTAECWLATPRSRPMTR